MVKLHDLAWAAGFFEGEGHIKLTRRRKDGGRWLAIEVAQVHREPLDKMVEVLETGKVYGPYGPYSTQRQPYYTFVIYGEKAEGAAVKMLPWLFHKGEQVQKALSEYKDHKSGSKAT